MVIGNISIFAALKTKMDWHQTRQTLLAENIANAETPNFRGRDLKKFSFEDHLEGSGVRSIATVQTHSNHIASSGVEGGLGGFTIRSTEGYEITPEGNSVVLEDEMMKVTGNQLEFQAATMLYTRSIKMIRTAMGR